MSATGLLLVYSLNTWLPELMLRAGFNAKGSLSFLLVLNGGAVLGALVGSRFADRFGPKPVVAGCFLIGALSIAVLTFSLPLGLLLLFVAIVGLGTSGTQTLIFGFVANYYRTNVRGAAVAWCAGFGRLGGIGGPLLGGFLIGAGLALNSIFYVLAGPAGLVLTLLVPVSRGRGGDDHNDRAGETGCSRRSGRKPMTRRPLDGWCGTERFGDRHRTPPSHGFIPRGLIHALRHHPVRGRLGPKPAHAGPGHRVRQADRNAVHMIYLAPEHRLPESADAGTDVEIDEEHVRHLQEYLARAIAGGVEARGEIVPATTTGAVTPSWSGPRSRMRTWSSSTPRLAGRRPRPSSPRRSWPATTRWRCSSRARPPFEQPNAG